MNPRQFRQAAWGIDVIAIPFVGVFFILGAIFTALLGRATFNNERITYADSPGKFLLLIAGGVAIGVACCAYGAIRAYLASRAPEQDDTRPRTDRP